MISPTLMRKTELFLAITASLLAIESYAATSADITVDFSPTKVFARESTAVTVFVSSKDPKLTLKRVTLKKLDEEGNPVEDMGDLYDHGRSGDAVKEDGKFGRKIQFTEKKKRHLTFLILAETSSGPIETRFEVQVLRRPSFIETMKLIWIRREMNKKLAELKTPEAFVEYAKTRDDVERTTQSPDGHILVDFKNGTQIEL